VKRLTIARHTSTRRSLERNRLRRVWNKCFSDYDDDDLDDDDDYDDKGVDEMSCDEKATLELTTMEPTDLLNTTHTASI